MASELIQHLDEQSFDRVISTATTPVLVDFWAEWCGPCKMIAPVLDEIAQEKGAALKVCKVDVDLNQSLARRFGVQAIPTLLLFKGGQIVSQIVGMTSKSDLLRKIESA